MSVIHILKLLNYTTIIKKTDYATVGKFKFTIEKLYCKLNSLKSILLTDNFFSNTIIS